MHKRDPRIMMKLRFVFLLGVVIAGLNSDSLISLVQSNFSLPTVVAADLYERSVSFFKIEDVFGYHQMQSFLKKLPSKPEDQKSEEKSISVCVVGEVNFPGQYECGKSSTVLSAILGAGGPSSMGSMRAVKILKGVDVCQEYDLYESLIGDSGDESPLLSGGETLVVPPSGIRVKVGGLVKNPFVYELKKTERTLAWLLKLAGGRIGEDDRCRVEIFRFVRGERRHVVSEELATSLRGVQEFQLEDGDQVELLSVKRFVETEVELGGHFRFPGKVVLKSETRLGDLITRENLMVGFAGQYAEILREGGKDQEYQVLSFSPEDVMAGVSGADLTLLGGDRVVIFSADELGKLAKIAVEGLVKTPGSFVWKEGMKISELIGLAGGLKSEASSVAELSRKEIGNGTLKNRSLIIDLKKAMSGDPRHDLRISPFDLLIVGSKK